MSECSSSKRNLYSITIRDCQLRSLLQNARRASQVAEPLAEWVTANIKYSYVIEKIEPLEKEQNELRKYVIFLGLFCAELRA